MDSDNKEIRKMILDDLLERVEILEDEILRLESDPTDKELINSIFRHFHTIKGTAGMARLQELADYSHRQENLLSFIRDGELTVNAEIISLYLESIDCLKNFISEATGLVALDHELIKKNLDAVKVHTPVSTSTAADDSKEEKDTDFFESIQAEITADSKIQKPLIQSYCIYITADGNFFQNIESFEKILNEFSSWGEYTIKPSLEEITAASESEPDQELPVKLHLKSDKSLSALELLIDYHLGNYDFRIETLPCSPTRDSQPKITGKDVTYQPLGNILAQHQVVHPQDIQSALEEQKPLGQILLEKGKVQETELCNALKVQEKQKQDVISQRREQIATTIRVDITKLDKLLNLVGEATITQFRYDRLAELLAEVLEREQNLLQIMEEQAIPEAKYHEKTIELLSNMEENLQQTLNHGERIMHELQEQSMRVRMVPIGSLFFPFTRLVRDYNMQHGKSIHIDIRGADTELDKTLVEKLGDPLKHLVRNAMDHGIETPEERKVAGKDSVGSITLDAFHKEGMIIIDIMDDGRGVNPEKVLTTAMKKGLLGEGMDLHDKELFHLLFEPGFSTTETVSELSGRGVGLDVVKREIEALHGKIDIQSLPGEGSTFRIKLPLTLSIIDGMLVGVGSDIFIIPLLSIIESLQPDADQVKTVKGGGEYIDVRGEYLPLIRLHNFFNREPKYFNPVEGIVVIVEEMGLRCCLLIDEIIDRQQTVIKSLEENFVRVDSIAGATILGNGQVCLILDIPGVMKAKKFTEGSVRNFEVEDAIR